MIVRIELLDGRTRTLCDVERVEIMEDVVLVYKPEMLPMDAVHAEITLMSITRQTPIKRSAHTR